MVSHVHVMCLFEMYVGDRQVPDRHRSNTNNKINKNKTIKHDFGLLNQPIKTDSRMASDRPPPGTTPGASSSLSGSAGCGGPWSVEHCPG